ncbi:DUF4190 domain-containing protein [Sphaerisporangium album]|nr:DUF4190 domain-containing protein [Sphaerisporangium album]
MNQQPYGPGGQQHHQYPPQRQWAPQPPPYHPQQPYPFPPGQMMPPEPRNSFGLAAMVCAIIGVLCGFVPIAFVIGGPLSVIAVVLGIAGMGRVRRGVADNSRTTNIATLLGIIALLMAFNGARITFTALNEFGTTINTTINEEQQRVRCFEKAETPDEILACSR